MKRIFLPIVLFAMGAAVLFGVDWNEQSTRFGAMAAENATAPAPRPKGAAAGKSKKQGPSAANSFNRLMKKLAQPPNARPSQDGIHDPRNAGTNSLQWPSEAFQDLPRIPYGNRVDWVKALRDGLIAPRYELDDPDAEVFTMDLVIVREVKGSMPDVVFPHLAHTEWLDCSNCHDEIFIPEKGANQVSMAAILLGQKCGVCHGRVAFPISDCRRCHARPKTEKQLKALAKGAEWRIGNKGKKQN